MGVGRGDFLNKKLLGLNYRKETAFLGLMYLALSDGEARKNTCQDLIS